MQPNHRPDLPELHAHADWRQVEFISDLHLHPDELATFDAWLSYLRESTADAIFILGDLFEVWVGDDAALQPGFEAQCLSALAQTAAQRPLFFIHGNRDFLIGQAFAQCSHVELLADPCVLYFGGLRCLLSHGDAMCTDDTPYQTFRTEVRAEAWQQAFLARPLAERVRIARDIRSQSEAKKRTEMGIAFDVDTRVAKQALTDARATTLIHGHTHRPENHDLGDGQLRVVLSDWDLSATPPRAEVLRLTWDGSFTTLPQLTRVRPGTSKG